MKFKLNGLEKFIIRHKHLAKWFFLVIYFLLILISINFDLPTFAVNLFLILSVSICFVINTYPNFKAQKLLKIHNEDLDMYSFLEGTNLMIEALNPKDIANISNFCNNRITALYNIGEYEKAETETRLFWQSFDFKKVPIATLASTHISMAMLALSNLDEKAYNDQMRIVYQYRYNSQNNALVRNTLDYAIESIHIFADAKKAEKNSVRYDFEARVLAHLNTNPINNKPRKKAPAKLEFFSAYCKLFVYYKNIENSQKATYYAQQLLNMGNEQLAAYHKAKEYLENANRSN